MLTIWLVCGGGLCWMLGCRYLLHVRHAQGDHRERMAEIAAIRARLADEVEQHRADRANRARPAVVEPGDTRHIIDWPTSDVGDRRTSGVIAGARGVLPQRGRNA